MGNLDLLSGLGDAREYLERQCLMLQQPDTFQDFVIGTGLQESVRGVSIRSGFGLHQVVGRCCPGNMHVPGYQRCSGSHRSTTFCQFELQSLLVDPINTKENLGWSPTMTPEELVAEMLKSEWKEAKKENYFKGEAFEEVVLM